MLLQLCQITFHTCIILNDDRPTHTLYSMPTFKKGFLSSIMISFYIQSFFSSGMPFSITFYNAKKPIFMYTLNYIVQKCCNCIYTKRKMMLHVFALVTQCVFWSTYVEIHFVEMGKKKVVVKVGNKKFSFSLYFFFIFVYVCG